MAAYEFNLSSLSSSSLRRPHARLSIPQRSIWVWLVAMLLSGSQANAQVGGFGGAGGIHSGQGGGIRAAEQGFGGFGRAGMSPGIGGGIIGHGGVPDPVGGTVPDLDVARTGTVIAEEVGDGFFLLEASAHSASTNQSLNAGPQATASPQAKNPLAPRSQTANQTPADQGQSKEQKADSRNETKTTQVLARFVTRTVFQQPSTTSATEQYESFLLRGGSSRTSEIAAALQKPITIDCGNGLSLREFETMMTDTLGTQVKLDERVLADEVGLDIHEPEAIRGAYSDITARSALRQLLGSVSETPLTYVIKDETLLITDKQYAADNYLSVRIYPQPLPRSPRDVQSLCELIQNVVAPTTWNSVGGPGAISPLNASLVVSQTHEVHEDIETLLREIERIAGIEHGTTMLHTHHIKDESLLNECVSSLASRVNAVLGDRGDPSATVNASNGVLFIQSSSRPFLVYATELISALQGRTVHAVEWCAPSPTTQGVTLQGNLPGTTQTHDQTIIGYMGGGMGGGLGGMGGGIGGMGGGMF